MSEKTISPLRQRMIEDMSVRNFVEKTRNDYIRHVKTFTAFLGRSPETATPEDLRRFQLHQTQTGVRPPIINGSVVALRFFFTVTVGQANMARHLTFVREPRKIPVVLSEEEIASLPAGSFLGGFRTASVQPEHILSALPQLHSWATACPDSLGLRSALLNKSQIPK